MTAEGMLSNKIWYLEKKTTPTTSYIYTGVSTFSFRLQKDNKYYIDTDGIIGNYSVTEQPADISLNVTANGRLIDAYNVTQLEKDHVVMEYSKNNVLNTFYFSTRP